VRGICVRSNKGNRSLSPIGGGRDGHLEQQNMISPMIPDSHIRSLSPIVGLRDMLLVAVFDLMWWSFWFLISNYNATQSPSPVEKHQIVHCSLAHYRIARTNFEDASSKMECFAFNQWRIHSFFSSFSSPPLK
jgi:hypothetical protein